MVLVTVGVATVVVVGVSILAVVLMVIQPVVVAVVVVNTWDSGLRVMDQRAR